MSEFNYNQNYGSNYGAETLARSESALMKNVYLWMSGAMAVTALVAYYVSSSVDLLTLIFGNQLVFWGLIIAEFGLVIALNAAINKISAFTATIMFLLYSVVNGATLSSIFLVYQIGSIASTFVVTAVTFAVMAIYGATTKTDLTKIGNICLMALIGLILATLVNLFLHNSVMELICSGIGVLIFTALTAYDSQKIKQMLYGAEENDTTQKIAILGALSLYLDFINLFLYLLRIFGRRD